MTREQAIAIVLAAVAPDTAVIACNGHVSRIAHARADAPNRFYMIGSMGLAPAIALGIAAVQPRRRVAVLDGDGNVLMALGTLASVAACRPARFAHFCFDNASHSSTGGQRTISEDVDLGAIARSAGYARVARPAAAAELADAARAALACDDGPVFVHVRVSAGGLSPAVGRVAIEPAAMTARLREMLAD